ncbi:MAG TPA: hypothetical protein GXZ82_06640 [Firmicutes bacterium]|jgi:hypothetical protein|nr:hypothetical protein [Bacillota bacterium]
MYTSYRYYFIEPLEDSYVDTGEPPLVAFTVEGTIRQYEVAIIGDEIGVPQMSRIALSSLPTEEIPKGALATIQLLKEHALSVLSLVDDASTTLYPVPFWIFVPDGAPPCLKLQMQAFKTHKKFDGSSFMNMFNSGFEVRTLLRLLAESRSPTIPLHYRYFSLYRILELRYKVQGDWTADWKPALAKLESRFRELSISPRSLGNYIEICRNRCAHGRFRNARTDVPGITTLNNEALSEIQRFMPLMTELAIEAINTYQDSRAFRLSTKPFTKEVSDDESNLL